MGKSKIIIGLLCLSLSHISCFGQCYSVELLTETYRNEIGIRELTGSNDGARVEIYLASVGLGKGYAWCAAFVCWAHIQAGIVAPVSAWTPSLFTVKNTIYERGKNTYLYQEGDVFGLYFIEKKRIAHVGFIDGKDGNNFITVEGNTNEAGSREGDGVYRKRRNEKTIYKVARNAK